MAVALAVISFVCAALFSLFFPIARIRTSVPNLAIVFWLGGCSLIHTIDSLIWVGNVNIHVPVWCDIVTKLMLGVNVALPGALLCILRELELVASYRRIFTDKRVVRNRMILDLFICYILPIIYMSLHIIIQDRRFDLVRDYGCFASSHPSTAAFLVLWLPPLLLSGVALALAGLTIHNIGRIRGTSFATHVESRSSMNSSMIVRKLTTCMAVAIALILIRLASLFTINSFQQWTSLSDVHRLIFKVQVVELPEDVTKALFDWWSFFAISVLYLSLAFILGEETRDIYRFITKQFQKKRNFPSLNLPLYKSKPEPTSNLKRPSLSSTLSTSLGKPKLRPLGFEFKSGWDDTLDEKNVTRFKNSRIDKPPSPSRTSSPTPSDKSTTDEDKAFIISTLTYLGSPTARTLGITSPTEMQLPPVATPGSSSKRPPSPPTSSTISEPMIRAMPVAYVPVDVEPGHEQELNVKSVLNARWPVPPASPSPSLSHYSTSSATRSRSNSSASSPAAAEESFGYPLYPTITPPHRRVRPFDSSTISPSQTSPFSVAPISMAMVQKSSMKQSAIQTLKRSFSREQLGRRNEVIHMTVV